MTRSRVVAAGASARPRHAGITLTEILISILIMGVGMLSLATLFPLGLMRIRDAARSSRSAMLFQSAGDEMSSRDLLYKPSFPAIGYAFDPFTEDPASLAEIGNISSGLDRIPAAGSTYITNGGLFGGPGIPVAYDPMWWYQTAYANGFSNGGSEFFNPFTFRFGSGAGHLRADPSGGAASAYGLQRISNFPCFSTYALDPSSVFASPDDLIMQVDATQPRDASGNPLYGSGRGSPIVPDLSSRDAYNNPVVTRDYSYTWMFTGRQTDTTNGTIFDGDVVIFHNRPFGIETVNGQSVAAGETVVEAIWGYGAGPLNPPSIPYNATARSVLLRWPVTQADPDVRVGGFIADVTYERFNAVENARFYPGTWLTYYPAQRCYWYRVAKKSDVTSDNQVSGYRQMIVTVSSDLRAKTPLSASGNTSGGTALHLNAALICPAVVNVVPKTVYTR